jgi:hypothetical protein
MTGWAGAVKWPVVRVQAVVNLTIPPLPLAYVHSPAIAHSCCHLALLWLDE